MNVIHVYINQTAAIFALLEASKHPSCQQYLLSQNKLRQTDGSVHRYVSQHQDPDTLRGVDAVVAFHCPLEPSTSDAWVALRDAQERYRVTPDAQ